jgi:phosphatidylglycerol:prolipoprotein diacylglycerol transferase
MYPVIRIGPAAIQSSILALIVALWVAATLAEREWKRRVAVPAGESASGEAAWNVIALVVAVTLVAGRLVYVGQNPSAYVAGPLQILSPTPSTLSLGVGAAIGILVGLAYVQRRRLPLLPLLDALAPGVLAATAIIALGQFLSGDAYGSPTDVPWAVFLWGQWRHPVQLYDLLAALSGLVVVERIHAPRAGWVALVALAWYSGARVLIDGFRGDATVIAGGYRSTQVIALVVLLAALWLMSRLAATGERATMEEGTRSFSQKA